MSTTPILHAPNPPGTQDDEPESQDPAAPAEAESPAPSPGITGPMVILLALLGIITTGTWAMLHQWYGLLANRDNIHFSFEKIQGGFDSPIMRQTALVFLVLTVCFAATILILRAMPAIPRVAQVALLTLVVGAGTVNVLLYPVGALDVFNYMVELKLAFHYGENPYVVTFEAYREFDPYALPAFLVDITLFYGPAWLAAMWLPSVVAGFSDVIQTLIALKIFNAGLIAIAAFLISRYQRDSRLAWSAAALFLANPLVLFEGIANAHNDVLLTVFIVGAMIALQRQSPLAGPLLALSALVKLYTVALVPIFTVVALRERWSWKRIAVTIVLTAITVVATSTPWWGEGDLVDGLRAGLEESQEMDHVSPLSLARQYAQEQEAQEHHLPDLIRSRPSFEIVPEETQDSISNGFTVAFSIVTLVIAATVWKGRPPTLAAAETLLLLFMLMTNFYPWYLIPAVALLALHPDRLSRAYVIIASGLGLIYYPMFVYGHFNSGWTRFEVHQFLALFLVAPALIYLGARVATWRRDVVPHPSAAPVHTTTAQTSSTSAMEGSGDARAI